MGSSEANGSFGRRAIRAGVGICLLFATFAPAIQPEQAAAFGVAELVKDIAPGVFPVGSNPRNLTALGSTVFFTADDGMDGEELWKSDGTAAGTVLVKDVNPG